MSGKFSKRTIKELLPVLAGSPIDVDRVVYSVERGVALQNPEIRYDETTIFPGLLDKELPKTFGHIHPKNPKGIIYPEIYSVIEGKAWYLFQKSQEESAAIIEEVYLIEAKAGENVIIPPGFTHLSINPSKEKLYMANWVEAPYSFDYAKIKSMHGACYYAMESEDGLKIEFKKNNNYQKIPELIKLRPKEIPELSALNGRSLKQINPKKLEYLTKPENYLELLTIKNCFEKI